MPVTHIDEIDTPAILIDLDVMERNLERVGSYARAEGLRLRPHTKTHKIPALARLQVELGAAGVTVAKVGEAEVMLGAELPDLLLAYPVVGQPKLDRLMRVAMRTNLTVALDSMAAARALSAAAAAAGAEIGVLAEMDAGLRRVGVAPGAPLVTLAKEIQALPALRLRGIAFYPGHIKQVDEEGEAALMRLSDTLCDTLAQLRAAGIDLEIVSGGSTPTLWHSHRVKGMNEIRPGTYIFNDRNTWAAGSCGLEDCAATILTTVVSTSVPDQMIIDGGSKTFFSDRLVTDERAGFGYVTNAPEAFFSRMNEEHGYIELKDAASRFRVGDTVRIIPNHVCVAMNLHEQVYGVRGERVDKVWRVEARGKLQ